MIKSYVAAALVLLSVLGSPLGMAAVYQWVDENGKKHFSDTPPPHQKNAEDISDTLKPANIDESRSERQKLQKLFSKPTEEEQAYEKNKSSASQEKKRKQQQYCAYLKDRLRKISRRVVFVDKDGKDVKVSEAERKERVKNLQKMIKKRCD